MGAPAGAAVTDCPFCARIAAGQFDGTSSCHVVSFVPLEPVTPGHRLFVPRHHVEHRSRADAVGWSVGVAFAAAEDHGRGSLDDFNLITSSGPAATQTVPHVHVHYVPRRLGDGLCLPWTGQARVP